MNATLVTLVLSLTLTLGAGTLASSAAPRAATAAQELTPEELEALIEELAQTIEETYIFEEVAQEIGTRLRERLWEGAYEVDSIELLAGRITQDLRSVNNDLHLGARPIPPQTRELTREDPAEVRRQRMEQARRGNYGFSRLEILDGNVGYLDLRGFSHTNHAGDTAVAAMGFLANSDAVIIDLRRNGGGNPSMVQLLSSYFFEEVTHLNSFERRDKEQIDQFWTLPHVPGKKLVDVPLFVLTSARTFSAAEEFTYNMKNLERATIVGETTGGGAHPGGTHDIGGKLAVFIPDGRAINPISGTNWEGTGIPPHVAVPAAEALDVALTRAREATTGE